MTDEYTKHLEQLHAAQTIRAEDLNDILAEVSCERIVANRRVIAGEANEVYDVAFADGREVIVRIARDGRNFAQEQWAIRECALRGVPVPEMLGIWGRSTPDQPLAICVQRKVAGVLLPDADLPQDAMRQIVVQAGEYLSRIHAIPVKGFGYINGAGEGEFQMHGSDIEAFESMGEEFQALAQRVNISSSDIRRALQLVVATEREVTSEPCLTHNDFCAKHIMVADGALAAIIDFGEVAGSEPLSDFVRWDYYDSPRFPLAWLQEGYANKQIFDDSFAQRLRIKHIAFSLWVMRWYDMSGYAEGVAAARARFLRDLAAVM